MTRAPSKAVPNIAAKPEGVDIRDYRRIRFERRTHCLVCEKRMRAPLIELPDLPMTEIYTRRPVREKVGFLDQSFHFCQSCGHGQLGRVIDLQLQYGNSGTYNFRTSTSATASESVDVFVRFMRSVIGHRHFRHIVEVGCNDLLLLRSLESCADRLTGIDPILKNVSVDAHGKIRVIGDFIENVTLERSADVVICKDTLEHVPDPKRMIRNLLDHATQEALFFFQFPILETLLAGCRFDQVFHQHLNYFTLRSILRMLDELNCRLVAYAINYNLWGAILIAFEEGKPSQKFRREAGAITPAQIKERFNVFRLNMEVTRRRLIFLRSEKRYGYGAALMLPVLNYHLRNELERLHCVLDDDEKKDGLCYINFPVPVRFRSSVTDIHEAVIVLTAIASMNNGRRMLPKVFELNPRQVLIPLNTL